MELYSTIAAISTPYGTGGISIIRISGSNAVEIADRIFAPSSGRMLKDVPTHTIHHGRVVGRDGKMIDEVLVSVMLAPRTYTGEDVVEINCHGGLVVTKSVLEEVFAAGAVQASPGEFTKRAFLSGRMDLCEAEAVIDVINSKTSLEHSVSVNHLSGALSDKINHIRSRLLSLIANVQVLIDYPDEGLESLSDEEFLDTLKEIGKDIAKLYATSETGRLIRSGISSVIAGKPNVGKSSLLNLLAGSNRAIVTDTPGTTRDVIEEYISFGNVTLRLADTAGIRKTDDEVESIGVNLSYEYLRKCDLVIFMADATRGLDDEDMDVISSIGNKKRIALINKCESGSKISKDELEKYFDTCIEFSVKDEIGVTDLENAISSMFEMGEIAQSCDGIITNSRHRDALYKAGQAVNGAITAIESGIPVDTTFIDLENAVASMGEIVGLTVAEEIVDKIFHSFCVGK